MAFVLILNHALCMMGLPILVLAAVEFGVRSHSYKRGKLLAFVIILYPVLLGVLGTCFYIHFPRYIVEKNNPDPSLYKVRGYGDNLIYEGYENGIYKFDDQPMGSEERVEYRLEGAEGLDSDIKIGDRCYFFYSADDKISDDKDNGYPIFRCNAAKICLHSLQEESIAIWTISPF